MIAVDISVLVGIMRGEPDTATLLEAIPSVEVSLATTTVVAATASCARHFVGGRAPWLDDYLASANVAVAPFTAAMAQKAAEALRVMSRGTGHPAALNFGDALVYGHAAALDVPLLFKGRDFHHTSRRLDPRSIVPP